MDFGSTCAGAIIGAVYGGIIVYLFWRMAVTRIIIGRAQQSLDRFPDATQPELTAVGVVTTSRRAWITYAFLVIMLVVIGALCPIGVYLVLFGGAT